MPKSISSLYDGVNMTQVMFGEMAIHVPAWLVVQDQGQEIVSFIGSSRSPIMRYGAPETHVLMVGELVVRPHLLIATNAFMGDGLAGLIHRSHDEWLEHGRIMYAMGAK